MFPVAVKHVFPLLTVFLLLNPVSDGFAQEVPAIPSVDSAETAVKVAIAAKARQ